MPIALGPALSVVLPIHNERECIAEVVDELEGVLRSMDLEFEVVVIDDGSTDGSAAIVSALAVSRPWMRVVLLRRNCGQSAALDAGFRFSRGELIVTMDSDGQNDPADIPRLLGAMNQHGADFVSGYRRTRRDGLIMRKLPSRIANTMIRAVTGTRLRDLGCSLKLYRRELINDLHLYGEMHRFIGVLIEGMGARSIELEVNHRPRRTGRSKYGLGRTFKVLLDLVTVWFMRGYETKPIYIFGGAGLALIFLGTLLSAYVLYEKLAMGVFVHRNPLFILAVMMAVVGVQFMVLGLLAELLVRTYFEARGRPSYHIKERLNCTDPAVLEPKGPGYAEASEHRPSRIAS